MEELEDAEERSGRDSLVFLGSLRFRVDEEKHFKADQSIENLILVYTSL